MFERDFDKKKSNVKNMLKKIVYAHNKRGFNH